MSNEVINVSAYRFARLSGLEALRDQLIKLAAEQELKGTILLSQEGINLFVAGQRDAVAALVSFVRQVPGLAELAPKESASAVQPFRRMLVKIKREIISFGVDGIDPVNQPAPKLKAATLKLWLDEKRPITLLDTRNDYEVRLGTFEGAVDPHIDSFREFPRAVKKLPDSLKKQPIVMFCTGGIRCEKAGPFLQREGFEQVFQLDGGILKYFEDCGGAHFKGECFVFDERVGLDAALQPTGAVLCEVCQRPVTRAEQQLPAYARGRSCPACAAVKSQA